MTKTRSFHALEQFIGSYFHQDWTSEAVSADDVLLRFKTDNPQQIVAEVVRDIDHLLVLEPSEYALSKRLTNLGLCYDPNSEGRDYRQWLAHAKATLTH